MNTPLAIVILAAGQGSRMKSNLPKVLHTIGGKPMVLHCLDAAKGLNPTRMVVVTGHGAEHVETAVHGADASALFARQENQNGTGHAVLQTRTALEGFTGNVLVLYADAPSLTTGVLAGFVAAHEHAGNAVTFLSTNIANPFGFGRMVRDSSGKVTGIVEEKNASPEQRVITEVNTGLMLARTEHLWTLLDSLEPNPPKNEYYLTDLLHLALKHNLPAGAHVARGGWELLGVNDKVQLATAETAFQTGLRTLMQEVGVTLHQPETCFFRHDTVVEPGAVVGPFVVCGEGVTIEEGAVIAPFTHLENCTIQAGATVGPFARLRGGTTVESMAHIGNFVELKNTTFGSGSKAGHLSYLGDAVVGAETNIGAGTITANYNHKTKLKSQTTIGANASTGSHTTLVAPVTLGRGATTGAGTVIRNDVADGELVLSTPDQKRKPGYN